MTCLCANKSNLASFTLLTALDRSYKRTTNCSRISLSSSDMVSGILPSLLNVSVASSNRFRKKVREKSRECHNHEPQPFQDTKRKINPNMHKSNTRMKSTKISSLFPKRGNRNAKRTEKHKNKMTKERHKKIAS